MSSNWNMFTVKSAFVSLGFGILFLMCAMGVPILCWLFPWIMWGPVVITSAILFIITIAHIHDSVSDFRAFLRVRANRKMEVVRSVLEE